MALFRSVARPEKRDASGWAAFLDIFRGVTNDSGITVTADTSLGLPAVYRCVALNSETIASLPVDVYRKKGERREPIEAPWWLDKPNPEYSWQQFIQEVQTSLELDGNAFILKVSTDQGKLVEMWQLDPLQVFLKRLTNLQGRPLVYQVNPYGPAGTLQTGDTLPTFTFAANAIIHIKAFSYPRQLRGYSPIGQVGEAIGVGLASQKFAARFYGSGAHLSGVIETDKPMDTAATERLQEQFSMRHGGVTKSHAVGILVGGAKWKPMSVNPEEAQLLRSRQYTDIQIAHMFGVPPHMVTDAEGAKGYVTGVMAGKLDWYQTGLLPRITRLEKAFSGLLGPSAYIKFNMRALLRGDSKEEAEYLERLYKNRIICRNEWRALLDMNPIEGGDDFDMPAQPVMASADDAKGGDDDSV